MSYLRNAVIRCRILSLPLLYLWLFMGTPQAAWADAAELVEEARGYFAKGQINAGVIQLKNALQLDPTYAEARFLLGIANLQTGNLSAAEKELRRAKELDWPRQQTLLPLGRVLLLQNQFDALLKDITTNSDDSIELQSDIYALRGSAQLGLKRRLDAKTSLDKAAQLNPKSTQALLGLTQLALTEQNLSEAHTLINKVLTIDDKRIEGWIAKGQLQFIEKQYEQALAAFEKAVELQPKNLPALLGRSHAYLAAKEFDKALADGDKVLEMYPRHPLANYLRAQAFFGKKDLESSERALQQALQILPDHGPSLLLAGKLHYDKGNMAQSKDNLRRFISAFPDHLPARKMLAAAEMKLNRTEQAVELLNAVLNEPGAQQDAQFLALLGSALLRKGDYAQGSEYLKKAIEIAPDVSSIRAQLALSHLATGEITQAVAELETAVDLGPGLFQADVLLVMTHLRSGEFDQAVTAATTLASKRPDDPMPQTLLGAAYLTKNDLQNARQAFEQALQINPDYASAHLYLARLDRHANDNATAANRFQRILESDPKNLKAMVGLSQIAQAEQRPDEALQWLERAWAADPKAAPVGAAIVQTYLQRGEKLRALNIARELEYQSPGHPAMHRALGQALLATDDLTSATKNIAAWAAAEPNSVNAWHLLASIQMHNKRLSDATKSIDKALALNNQHTPSLAIKARLDLLQQRYDQALQNARAVQNSMPEKGIGYKIEGDVRVLQKDFAGAVKAYQTAYDKEPTEAMAQLLSSAQRRANNSKAALETLQERLANNPDDTKARLQMALLLQEAEQFDAAIQAYETTLQQDPNNIIALNNIAWLYGSLNDPKGINYAEKAVELSPGRPEIIDTLGWVLVQNNELKRGLRTLQEAAIQAPHIPDIRYHLAVAYEKLGRLDDAREELESLLNEGKDFADQDNAKALLAKLQN